MLDLQGRHESARRVHSTEVVAPTCNTCGGRIRNQDHCEPINTDAEGNAKCLRAGYFKAGAANFKEREDGFAQTAVKVNNNGSE
jgi:hypothetical protein